MEIDTSGWSGDGEFTQALIDALRDAAHVVAVRVEDAPASRTEAGYAFLANEVYVRFAERERREPTRWLGVLPGSRRVREPAQTIEGLAAELARRDAIGEADYVDDGMIQYLKAHRIVPPYQTRGYKLVEMVRIYRAGEGPARHEAAGATR